MKVAILHDYFDKMGGGEKLVLIMAKALNADIYTGFVTNTFPNIKEHTVIEIAKPEKNPAVRTLKLINKFQNENLRDTQLQYCKENA
jgi:hypothetical protein